MEFLSTPSARRATSRLPSTSKPRIFLSTPSARRATRRARAFRRPRGNFYPRPPRGGRPRARQLRLRICCISIHALREEGDGAAQLPTGAVRDFYPRPPRGGRRCSAHGCPLASEFLSTPSARRATKQHWIWARPPRISIHALREEGDPPWCAKVCCCRISIHALREEGDQKLSRYYMAGRYFYPRPPRGGRPYPKAPKGVA